MTFSLVKAGPEARRPALDILVSQLDRPAADELIRYRRVLEPAQFPAATPARRGRPRRPAPALRRRSSAPTCGNQVARTELVGALRR